MMPIKFTLWSAYAENEGKRLVEAQATIPEIHCTRVSVGYFNCLIFRTRFNTAINIDPPYQAAKDLKSWVSKNNEVIFQQVGDGTYKNFNPSLLFHSDEQLTLIAKIRPVQDLPYQIRNRSFTTWLVETATTPRAIAITSFGDDAEKNTSYNSNASNEIGKIGKEFIANVRRAKNQFGAAKSKLVLPTLFKYTKKNDDMIETTPTESSCSDSGWRNSLRNFAHLEKLILLSAYVKVGSHEEALGLFNLMMISWECPIEFTLSNVFWACSALWDSTLGTKIHIYAIKNGFGSNHILSSNLIDFHSKCSNTVGAYNIFRNMQNADNISWTTMISSFEKEGNWIKYKLWKLVHGQMIVWGLQLNLVLKTALVDMYAKRQRMDDAMKASNQTPENDVMMLWTTFSNWIQPQLESEGGAAVGETDLLRVIKVGLKSQTSVGNALIYMYIKCVGQIEDAYQAFEELASPNFISWTSLISGFVECCLDCESFQTFEEMQFSGVTPNSFTLFSILRACNST
ncbi:hypothetical protein M9H77_26611 [Catharanthus roseus]|uniref:Uncharacterized protein n=1 Tax=Catharanthus roseus TaxID=4058 RepID=A0ACC0AEF4_CATRO|nr:hypothetical protein M9H77_26611 [Catharanthus roseus]